jgi:gliding motility-associated-like protein
MPLLVNFKDNSNVAGTKYYWNFGDGQTDTVANPTHLFSNPGDYTINHMVSTARGCTTNLLVPAAVNVFPLPSASFAAVPEEASIFLPAISFFDESTYTSNWKWDFGDNSGITTSRNPEHTYRDSGTFQVRLISTSDKGCVDTTYRKVIIRGEFAVYIPNAFTPNKDEVNDMFMPLGIGVKEFEVFIYDRWGIKIYSSTDLKKGWDGYKQNGEIECPMDVYVYLIRIKDFKGKYHEYSGHVNLVR